MFKKKMSKSAPYIGHKGFEDKAPSDDYSSQQVSMLNVVQGTSLSSRSVSFSSYTTVTVLS